jgi:hypothetical protein
MPRRGHKAYIRGQEIRKAAGLEHTLDFPRGFDVKSARAAVAAIRLGATPRAACVAHGINLKDYEAWMARGVVLSERVADGMEPVNFPEQKDRICHAFYVMVMKALAHAAVRCGQKLAKDPDWRSLSWRMEKIYKPFMEPEDAPKAPVGPDGKAVGGTQVVVYVPDNGRSTR